MSAGGTPIEVHEAFVPTDEEQRFAMMVLEQAKKFMEEGNCEPTAYMIGPDRTSLVVMPLGSFGDWDADRVRDAAARFVRLTVKVAGPVCFAFVADAWHREFPDGKAIEAAGLDHRQYRKWRQEDLDRFMVMREVIMVSLETKERQFLLTQFYRRSFKDRPIWEETKLSGGFTEGRFVGMLRGDQ